jgi:hypothetical protein
MECWYIWYISTLRFVISLRFDLLSIIERAQMFNNKEVKIIFYCPCAAYDIPLVKYLNFKIVYKENFQGISVPSNALTW